MTVTAEAHPVFDGRAFASSLPPQPGVYRMYAADGELIYVGKATRLRDRVGSYFSGRPASPKVEVMVKRVVRMEVTLTNSEHEALVLESNLIKAHRPRYNVILRDGKTYPYILCTDHADFPRLMLYRSPKAPVGKRFGPFPDAGAARDALHHLQKVFRIRNCRDAFFANRSRPCLQYQIGRCSAPCVGLVTREQYQSDLHSAMAVLAGRNLEVGAQLQQRMEQAAAALRFEEAAALRDQMRELQSVQVRQIAVSSQAADVDVVALVGEPGQYALCVLPVRDGQSLESVCLFPGGALGDPADTGSEFLLQYYVHAPMPAEIAVNWELTESQADALMQALETVTARRVSVQTPMRGIRRRWIELAEKNARNALSMRIRRTDHIAASFDLLAQVLHLPGPLARIECFDVSHTMGEGTVASCVVATREGPLKSDYRRYNIRDAVAGDDYGAMAEALRRHGARILAGTDPRPDVLFIDGGPGQINAVQQVLQSLGLDAVPLVGVAKGADRRVGQERLFRPGAEIPIILEPDSPALHLIQRVRDEAHRFAITGHRRRRARRFKDSILETVPGLGPARRRAILTHFGGLQGVMRAGVADLEIVPGVGPLLARSIYEHLHPGD